MPTSASPRRRTGLLTPLTATLTLAVRQIGHVWRLCLLITLGMIATVVLICSLPLFSQVTSTAKLRNTFNSGLYENYSFVQGDTQVLSSAAINRATQRLTQGYQRIAGDFFQGAPDRSVQLQNLTVSKNNKPLPQQILQVTGYDFTSIKPHVAVTEGRLPQPSSIVLEVALTESNAVTLNAQVGDTLTIMTEQVGSNAPIPVQLSVVGIFRQLSPFEDYWHGNMFDPYTDQQTMITHDFALASNAGIFSTVDALAQAHSGQPIAFSTSLFWYYPLNVAALTSTNITTFRQDLDHLTTDLPDQVTRVPYVTDISITSNGITSTLDTSQGQTSTSQVSVILLTLLMLGLTLFFVGLMTEILVNRQAEAIALTSHRGGSFQQIFVTFVVQSLILGLITLVISPTLMLPTVRILIQLLLQKGDQSALNALPPNLWEVALTVRWYLLAAVLISVLAMSVSVWRTLRSSTLGRSVAQTASTQRPLWQRYYADLVLALLGLLTYGFYTYLASSGSIDPQQQILLAAPCMLVAATLLTLAGILLYLRLFPLILRLGVAMAARRRGVVPLLSLVVMARAPRQAMRTALLLVLTISFALFALVFTASQTQRETDLADYRVGADFSGSLPQSSGSSDFSTTVPTQLPTASDLHAVSAPYQKIPGVLSVAVANEYYHGFRGTQTNLEVIAIDPTTFFSSVIWSQETAGQNAQAIQQMLTQLSSQRRFFTTAASPEKRPLPAIVDSATKNILHLSVGSTFIQTGVNGEKLLMVDVGEVNHIPSANDEMPLAYGGIASMLVDYQSYVPVYNKVFNDPNADFTPNRIWLHTQRDASSLAGIRRALSTDPLKLDDLNDHQAELSALQHDPLYLNLLCALTLGVALALLLALLGNITSAWIQVQNRLRSLAVLRALGTAPAQLATLMSWEQGLIYGTALVLGVLFGAFFTAMTLGNLVFSGVTQSGSTMNLYSADIFVLQSVPEIQTVIPPTLLIGLVALFGLCIIALAITVYTVSRPSLSQTLRLGEDYVEDAPLFVARTTETTGDGQSVRPRQRLALPGKAQPIAQTFTPLRRSWSYLLLTGCGIAISVILACAVPLFSEVAATAGLRDVLALPQNTYVTIEGSSFQYGNSVLTPANFVRGLQTATSSMNTLFLNQTKQYFSDQPITTFTDAGINVRNTNDSGPATAGPTFYFSGLPARSMAGHFTAVQGHLPQSTGTPLQIALTPDAATFLHVHVGDVLPPQAGHPFPVQVVGLFQPTMTDDPLLSGPYYAVSAQNKNDVFISALVSSEAFIAATKSFGSTTQASTYEVDSQVTWHYRISGERVNSTQLEDLTNTLTNIHDSWSPPSTLNARQITVPSSALTEYQNSVQIAGIPVVTTSVLIIALILLFLSFMSELLVEREASTIAVLRSRGATRQQIFGAFFRRGVVLNVLGFIAGVLLVIPVVTLLTHITLQPGDQNALDVATARPVQALLNLAVYALGCVLITLVTMTFALYQATGADYLSLRRDAARSTRRPLWQRFYLDVVGALIALLAYGFSLYLTNSNILDPQTNVQVKSPLVLTATLCLIITCSLLFLRFFPLLLRLGTRLAMRNRNVAPMLALAQMARNPRQSLRVALLLIFTSAFVVFVSVFTATQNQHVNDVASYWTGADFSGPLANAVTAEQQPALHAEYQHIRGVTSAATGAVGNIYSYSSQISLKLIAVDPTNFLHTVFWPEISTPQQQNALAQDLTSKRAQLARTLSHADASPGAPEPDDAVPAVVDTQTWKALNLTKGIPFRLQLGPAAQTFLPVEEVAHIPTINDTAQTFGSQGDLTSGLLVDYQSYASAYNYYLQRFKQAPISPGQRRFVPEPMQTNYVWLSTSSDANALANVRNVLSNNKLLQLGSLYDRRATNTTLNTDPLGMNLIGILILGALAPLILTWIGCLIATWVTARQRQTLFGVLRALGSTPRQLVRVLAWEQGIVYGVALLLGTLFGLLTALMALPALVLTSTIPGIYTQGSGGRFQASTDTSNSLDLFSLQNTPAAHTVVPPTLALVVGLLVVLAILVVLLLTRNASRIALAQALRLNED